MGEQTGKGRYGFTLIEVLLSVFLVAIISGILFASFFIPLRSIKIAGAGLQKTEEATVFLSRLSEEITGAYAQESSFSGGERQLSFLSSAGTNLGLEKVTYAAADGENEKITVYRSAALPYEESASKNNPVFQAEKILFRYHNGREWKEEWSAKGLPVLVSIDLLRSGREYRILCRPRASAGDNADTDSDTVTGRGGTAYLP